jgi:methyltransferase (TIGR00027 family)
VQQIGAPKFFTPDQISLARQQNETRHRRCAEKYAILKTKVLAVFSRSKCQSATTFLTTETPRRRAALQRSNLSSKNNNTRAALNRRFPYFSYFVLSPSYFIAMPQPEPLIRDISDTALWAAIYRARETDRAGALFHDPFAGRLAGERGERIAAEMEFSSTHLWSWTVRTYLFDQFISEQIQQGVDLVVNLAAGLDARPYRMALPASLRWVEVDLPQILDYKEQVLAGEKPVCALERVRLDLSDAVARRALFERLGGQGEKALIITEGLIIYLTPDEVGSLAQDLAQPASFQRWVTDLASPRVLAMLQKNVGSSLKRAGSPLKFGPEQGGAFFQSFGWRAITGHPMLKTAARLHLLPFWLRVIAMLPGPATPEGSHPFAGVCLLGREQLTTNH